MSAAERWLRERLDGRAPEPLLRAMIEALPGTAAATAPVPELLAEGALALYAAVVRGSGGREDAEPLLAADALYTHALEAQAELDLDGLEQFAARYGAGRLRGLLP